MNIPVTYKIQDSEYKDNPEIYEGVMIAVVGGTRGIYGIIQTKSPEGSYFKEVSLRDITPKED